jgi:hypothetical protein
MPTPIGPGDGIVTASVAVNNCAATYVRSAPSMNAPGVALVPAGSGPINVYSTPLVGGDWGALSGPYTTCDGSGDMWYELADGPNAGDYIFSGGVHVTAGDTVTWHVAWEGVQSDQGLAAQDQSRLLVYPGDVWHFEFDSHNGVRGTALSGEALVWNLDGSTDGAFGLPGTDNGVHDGKFCETDWDSGVPDASDRPCHWSFDRTVLDYYTPGQAYYLTFGAWTSMWRVSWVDGPVSINVTATLVSPGEGR